MKVAIGLIRPNAFQVRKHVDRERVQALANEIKALGYWGGLRARKQGSHYELCFGHRRLEALKLLKVKEVDLDVVDLSDDDMAIQALVENLQREGLTDLEKAEGIKLLLDRSRHLGPAHATTHVAQMLGFSKDWLHKLLRILEYSAPTKKLIERGDIAGRTAMEATNLGGDAMVQTAAKHKLPLHTVTSISRELSAITEPTIREKVKKAVVAGKVRDPESVREHARKVTRQVEERSGKRPPPDLHVVIRMWTQTMTTWAKKLAVVLPYIDYIEEDTKGAAEFKAATRELIDTLKRFL